MISYSAVDYLKIDIANQYGEPLDKKSFPQRIAWVNSVKDLHSKVSKAEKPAQYLAAVLALEDAYAGVPSGHLVGLDACASGIAILGILIGCHTTSANTGVIGQKRMDIYGECTEAMNGLLSNDISISRADAKKATMTSYYGSVATPKRIFGDETDELFAFYDAQETVAPGACIMMREFLDCWQPYALNHSHSMPDGFEAVVPVLQKMKAKIEIDELNGTCLSYIYEDNIGSEKGLAVAANCTHAVDSLLIREVNRRCNYDREKLNHLHYVLHWAKGYSAPTTKTNVIEQCAIDHKFISLRGVEFVTKNNVFDFSEDYRDELLCLIEETMSKPSFEILMIHDEIKALPNHVNDMRETYRNVLAELADSNIGQQIIREVRNDPTYVLDKLTTNLGDEIMKAEYFLS